jgi:hypothetical protein
MITRFFSKMLVHCLINQLIRGNITFTIYADTLLIVSGICLFNFENVSIFLTIFSVFSSVRCKDRESKLLGLSRAFFDLDRHVLVPMLHSTLLAERNVRTQTRPNFLSEKQLYVTYLRY